MNELNVKTRDLKSKIEDIKASGMTPAVYYGAGNTATAISVDTKDFLKMLKKVGESNTLTLNLDSGAKKLTALIHSIDLDPVKNNPIHIDFLVVDINKPIEVVVPLEFTGESEVVKSGLGVMVKVLHEIHIKALPKDLPTVINVDISTLKSLDNHIKASDLILEKGVELITNKEEIIVSVSSIKVESEDLPPSDISSIEVEKKGKKEETE